MKSIPELSSETLDRLRSAVQWVDGEHLEYTGRKSATKDGVIAIQGEVYTVRRVIWRHVNGPIPDGHYMVCQCDFEGCVHPEHLSITDTKPNGRSDPLSDSQVRDIRRRYANNGTTHRELAREYDVSDTHVGKICRYEIRVEAGPHDDKLMRDIDVKGHARMNSDIAYDSPEYRDDGTLLIPPLTRKEVENQILSRTSKTDEGCLIFRGKKSEGHAVVTIYGVTYLAHRVVQKILNEHIPVGHHVYRTCNNQRCVNPDHLKQSSPENYAKSLSDEEVLEIRQAYENQSVSYADLAEEYGVTRSYIGKICRGEVRSSVRVEPR